MSNESELLSGRKRSRNEDTWKQNVQKRTRNKGEEYVSGSTGEVVKRKRLEIIDSCCSGKCFQRVTFQRQQDLHDAFWRLEDYKAQNVMISALTKKDISNSDRKLIKWIYNYIHPCENITISTCKSFLCKVLDVDKKRFSCVQAKMLDGSSLGDERGKHSNHQIKLTESLKQLITSHCESLPNDESHYTREDTKLRFFDNSDLTLSKLYTLFIGYFEKTMNDPNPPLDFSTYAKFFNHHVNFSFRRPRTDVCNFCYEHETRVDKSEISVELAMHQEKVNDYMKMKKRMMNEQDALLCEFDFGQNLPLPKIPVNEQFYKRLLWLFIFNVHIFRAEKSRTDCEEIREKRLKKEADASYMFPFIEGYFKKGSNTVCNLLFEVVNREFARKMYNKIYFFSDSCPGQNKNYTMLAFLSLLSEKMQIQIEHLYPVRGHSYCQCDRNFGTYGQKKKKLERIESVDEYVEMIRTARNPPFTIVRQEELTLKDFEEVIKTNVKLPKNVKISEAVRIIYFPNRSIDIFYTYNDKPVTFQINGEIEFKLLQSATQPDIPGITKEKMKDVRSLMGYLTENGRLCMEQVLQALPIKKKEAADE